MEDREENVPRERTFHNRRFDAVAMGAFGVAITLLGFLGVAYRDNQASIAANLQSLAAQWSSQFSELAKDVRGLQRCAWMRGCK